MRMQHQSAAGPGQARIEEEFPADRAERPEQDLDAIWESNQEPVRAERGWR